MMRLILIYQHQVPKLEVIFILAIRMMLIEKTIVSIKGCIYFWSISFSLLFRIIMYRNNVSLNYNLVIQANLSKLSKADTCLERITYLVPQVSALDGFYCIWPPFTFWMLIKFVQSFPNKMFDPISISFSSNSLWPLPNHIAIFPIRVHSFSNSGGELKVFQNHRVAGG